MRNRILAVTAAVVVALGIGGIAALQSNAAPVKAAPVLSTTERGLCIKEGTGEPRSLWLVEATGKCPAPYWGPASLEDAFGIKLPTPAPAPRPAPAPVETDAEAAPVLSLNGQPGPRSVALKWTKATAPDETTVIGYQLRYRRVTDQQWLPNLGPITLSNVLRYTVSGVPRTLPGNQAGEDQLAPETSYFFQVRARYSTSTDFGPWSNTLSAATGDLT